MKILTAAEKHRQAADNIVREMLSELSNSTTSQPSTYIAQLLNNASEKYLAMFITEDEDMLELKQKVRRLASIQDPVLITGPSGTGKELLAHALHGMKDPKKFFAVNCAGMPDQLIESELFGHVRGSFTGAVEDKPGILAAADGGTVLLDEIGEAPGNLQAKLLRALQPSADGKYYIRPVGSNRHVQVNCRILASTKRDLFEMVKAKEFREDLYGRLMTFELVTKPIQQRPADKVAILNSLNCTDREGLDDPYWIERIELFNVRALIAFAKRKEME
jgi:transcriptional regulator with PAS, ATPase and Fis domain